MTKMSDAMVKGLRAIAATPGTRVRPATMEALRSRFMIKNGENGAEITPSGRSFLDGIDRAEREAAYRAERASRPVPAQIGEPSASRPLVLDTDMGNGCNCDQDGCPVCFPESTPGPVPAERVEGAKFAPAEHLEIRTGQESDVPQAWIDQLVTLLDADAQIVRTPYGWRARAAMPSGWASVPDRLDTAATEAIRLGIAEALSPTPGRGVIRLALKR